MAMGWVGWKGIDHHEKSMIFDFHQFMNDSGNHPNGLFHLFSSIFNFVKYDHSASSQIDSQLIPSSITFKYIPFMIDS